ncbi:MAG: hypothetical protein ABIQ35_02620 [Verrucomicrobiota bacterium]
MRILILILTACLLGTGCAKMKSWLPSAPGKKKSRHTTRPAPDVMPATSDTGKIAMVNAGARFVVMTFPIGGVPSNDQRLNVYRKGLKVAELKVTGPQRENNTVADILSGEVQVNDEVRAD